MACGGFWGCLLKILNFLLTLSGLAMVGYGIYLLVVYQSSSSIDAASMARLSPTSTSGDVLQLGRPMLMAMSLSASILDDLPSAWFIYLFIGVGAILFIISCFGCIGTVTQNGCCLTCYSVLVILLILVELGCAAFIFFDSSWKDDIPTDDSGDFTMIYDFLEEHWTIIRWVALGAVILEAFVFLLSCVVRAANRPVEYDSDDDLINRPLINRPPVPATGVPVTAALDQRPVRTDAWSTRMREKYGLDTSQFPYNPSDPNRYPQTAPPPTDERRGCCTIM